MKPIKVPRTPKRAFNPKRRPSSLLLKQIEHLEWAALPASQRKPGQLPTRKVKTEGQAAERIGQLTAMVMAAHAERGVQPAGVALPPVVLPPLPPARTGRRSPTSRRPGTQGRAKKRSPKR